MTCCPQHGLPGLGSGEASRLKTTTAAEKLAGVRPLEEGVSHATQGRVGKHRGVSGGSQEAEGPLGQEPSLWFPWEKPGEAG